MNNEPKKTSKNAPTFTAQVGAKAARKLKARRNPTPGVWFGLGMMGLIGWSVVVPTLLGAALGLWLDNHYAGRHSWTLALLVAGLVHRLLECVALGRQGRPGYAPGTGG